MLKYENKKLLAINDGKERSHLQINQLFTVYQIIVLLISLIILLPLNGKDGSQLWSVETAITSLPPVVRIGAIYGEYQRAGSMESAFKYAIYRINKDKSLFTDTQLIYDIEYIRRDDTFRSTKRICKQFENAVPIIIGPSDIILARHIQSMCSSLKLPYIGMFVNDEAYQKYSSYAISFYPTQGQLNKAYTDLFIELNWTNIAILYEDSDSVFKQPEEIDIRQDYNKKLQFYVRQVNPTIYRTVLRAILQKQIYNIVVDINYQKIYMFLRVLLQLQMNDHRYHYIFTTFDLESVDLEDFKYNNVNITSFRLVDVDSQRYNEITAPMRKLPHTGLDIIRGHSYLMTESAMIFDAVYTFAAGLKQFAEKHSLNLHNVSCELENSWENGRYLYESMNELSLEGLTGQLNFKNGQRSQLKFDLLQMKGQQLRKMGTWTLRNGINFSNLQYNGYKVPPKSNITLLILTKEEKPYVIIDQNKNLTGNSRFKGYCIDLLDAIAERVGFKYRLQIVEDNFYGIYNPETKRWNGIVHELMEKRADLSVAPMTITPARSKAIDFTEPFANVGISILYKMPSNRPTRLLLFMHPLAMETWFYVFAAYILVSLGLFVMARFSPYEWHRPSHPSCLNLSDIVENQFSLSNSFWFITGTFLLRRSGINPQATSTRIVGVIWWFFTLIIISSYTANLAAFLTIERISDLPIDSVIDLVEQTDIAYGALNGGSTMAFFRESKIALYQKIWHYMEQRHRSVLVQSFEEGIRKVENGNYAFLTETPLLEYAIRNNCNFTQVGGLLSNTRAYAIATPKGSIWREPISEAIHSLNANGFLQSLHEKWLLSINHITTTNNINKDINNNRTTTVNITTTIAPLTTTTTKTTTTIPLTTITNQTNPFRNNNFIIQKSFLPSSSESSSSKISFTSRRNSEICNPHYNNIDEQYQDYNSYSDNKQYIDVLNVWKQPVNALHLENVAGVFMVLLCGLATAAVVAVIEFLYNSRINGQQADNQLLCSEMSEELRHAIHCPLLHLTRQSRDGKCFCYKCIQQQHSPSTCSLYRQVNCSNSAAAPVAMASVATTATNTHSTAGILNTSGSGANVNNLTATLPTPLKRVQYTYLN